MKNPIVVLLSFAILFSSCSSFKTMKIPYSESIPKSLKKGSTVRLTLTNGLEIKKIRVKQVWPDSILLESDTTALRISDIAKIQQRRVDPALTVFVIALPVTILVIMASQFQFTMSPL